MIVIHIDSQKDTAFLKDCYKGIDNIILLYNPTKDEVNKTLQDNPDEDVMMLGHGSPSGLFSCDWRGNVIDAANAHLLKGSNCIGIWCWAKKFAKAYGLKGYFTSMFISNGGEAKSFGFPNATEKEVFDEVEFFAKAVNTLIKGNVPYEEWEEDMLHTAYITLFGLYYFDTSAKDLMRWLGKDEPKNPKFVNARNRHETITNISIDRMGQSEHEDRPKKKMFISDEEFANGVMGLNDLRKRFKKLVDQIAKGNTLRFCQEKEETAFGVFMSGLYAMMMPGEDVNRKGMVGSKENARMVYQAAKKMLMGDVVTKGIVTADDDNAAAEVFYWGLLGGEDGVRRGTMPTGLGELDIEVKPSQTTKN